MNVPVFDVPSTWKAENACTRQRIVYQPECDEGLWQDTGFCSFMAFRTEDECRRVFPTLDPVRYAEDDIEDLAIVSTDDFPKQTRPLAN